MNEHKELEITKVSLKRDKLVVEFKMPSDTKMQLSPTYVLIGTVAVQIQSQACIDMNRYRTISVSLLTSCNISFVKPVLKLSSNYLQINKNLIVTNDKNVHLIYDSSKQSRGDCNTPTIDITICADVEDTLGMFDSLYDDTDLIDFELCGEGGSVSVHKAVLAVASPVFKRMLSSDWKEKSTGNLTIPGVSKAALEHFKAYMYLRKIPNNTDLEQLLLIAACYDMPGFELKCIESIMKKLTVDNILDWCEFAAKARMTRLHLAILEHIQSGEIMVGDIYDMIDKKVNKD